MKKNILFLITFISINLIAQKNNRLDFRGNWIKYRIEMKDGSSIIDRFLTDSSYINFTFQKYNLKINGEPTHRINESIIPYNLIGDFIKTSPTSGYHIEKVKQDTLIICEKINGLENDKLKRFYFVREQKLFNEFHLKKSNDLNQIANRFYTPTLKSSLELELNNAFKNKHSNFKAKGSILINLKNRKVKTSISYSDTKDSTKINLIKKIINQSYKLWRLNRFKKLQTIELPFVLKDEKTRTFYGISMEFFTDSFSSLENYGGDVNVNKKAGGLFSEGIKAYQNKNYLKAIDKFSKSYELDPKKIDALYNRAVIYYEIDNIESACKDWKELSKLGQKKGIELFKNNCKKTTYNKSYN